MIIGLFQVAVPFVCHDVPGPCLGSPALTRRTGGFSGVRAAKISALLPKRWANVRDGNFPSPCATSCLDQAETGPLSQEALCWIGTQLLIIFWLLTGWEMIERTSDAKMSTTVVMFCFLRNDNNPKVWPHVLLTSSAMKISGSQSPLCNDLKKNYY